jgi:hemerythrin superfamily protein
MPQTLTDALRKDHVEVRNLFVQIEAAQGDERRELFDVLVRDLVRHESAEEEVLRPVSKRDVGAEIPDVRISEEKQAQSLLREMLELDVDSDEFRQKFSKLHQEVERHAAAEEAEEFPMVEQKETSDHLEALARDYEKAKEAAPSRPRV